MINFFEYPSYHLMKDLVDDILKLLECYGAGQCISSFIYHKAENKIEIVGMYSIMKFSLSLADAITNLSNFWLLDKEPIKEESKNTLINFKNWAKQKCNWDTTKLDLYIRRLCI